MAARIDWKKFRATLRREKAAGKTEAEAMKIANAESKADIAARQAKLDEAKAKKAAQAKTCQICGRPIFAEVGLIAHHGYERPGMGYQTASCEGARELPFEVSKDILVDHIVAMKNFLDGKRKARKAVADEKVPFYRSYEVIRRDENNNRVMSHGRTVCDTIQIEMIRANFVQILADHKEAFDRYEAKFTKPVWHSGEPNEWFDADAGFTYFKELELSSRDLEIKRLTDYITRQEKRRDEWKPTQKWDAEKKVWVKL